MKIISIILILIKSQNLVINGQFIGDSSSQLLTKDNIDETLDSYIIKLETKTVNSNLELVRYIMDDINNQCKGTLDPKKCVNFLSRMVKTVDFNELGSQMREGISSFASCLTCHVIAGLLVSPIYSKEMMIIVIKAVCASFKLETPEVCSGLAESYKYVFDYVRTHTSLGSSEMCGVIFGMNCARKVTKNLNWTISIPERPKMHKDLPSQRSDEEVIYDLPISKNYATVIQVTDIHIDPYYTHGMNADCGNTLCCRPSDGLANVTKKAAGVWGDYRNCDLPVNTLDSALKQISEKHPDALYWMYTGDLAPHNIWDITREEVLSQISLVTNLMKHYARVPVYPVIGNHEAVPDYGRAIIKMLKNEPNFKFDFSPPEVKGIHSNSWLYNAVAEEWSQWLPKDAIKTLKYGGYYTVKPREGLRIVSINTNYCARLNPWNLFNPIDSTNQLKWLAEELLKAESYGDKVHIIGHIPPDNRECTQAWLYNFLRIIERFQDVVIAQYYGHTHTDEFRIFYSPYNQGVPIGLAYIGPSLTPYTEINPSYRLYYLDNESYLLDHETYYFNLTEANRGKSGPNWVREYNAVGVFNITTMGPKGWHEFVYRLENDDNLFQNFYQFYHRRSDVKGHEHCNTECKKAILIDLKVLHPLKNNPKGLFGRRKYN